MHRLVRVVRFTHEPLGLIGALADTSVPENVEAGEFYLLVDGRGPTLRMLPIAPKLGRRLAEIISRERLNWACEEDAVLRDAGLLSSIA